jgi:hypothetical protein
MFEGVSVFALVVVAFSVVTALMGVRQAPRRTVPSVPDASTPVDRAEAERPPEDH